MEKRRLPQAIPAIRRPDPGGDRGRADRDQDFAEQERFLPSGPSGLIPADREVELATLRIVHVGRGINSEIDLGMPRQEIR